MKISTLIKRAEANDPQAQYSLAYAYECGDGAEENDEEALKWYGILAEQGFELADNFCKQHRALIPVWSANL